MQRNETLAIMAVLKAAYPRYYAGLNRRDAEDIVNLWTEMFANDSARDVTMAVKALIATDSKGFPPHIGAVKTALARLKAPEEMTEYEAWGTVANALRNSLYGYAEEFAALPEVVQRVVGSALQLREWAMMDTDTLNSVVASNFQRSYRARAANEREFLALPEDVRNAVTQLTDRMRMPELGEKVE